MIDRIKFSLISSLIPLIVIVVTIATTYLLSEKKHRNKINTNFNSLLDWKELAIFLVFNFLLYFLCYPIIQKLNADSFLSILLFVIV